MSKISFLNRIAMSIAIIFARNPMPLSNFFPTSWEQDVLFYLLKPFQIISRILIVLLWPLYSMLGTSSLEFIARGLNTIWIPIQATILLCKKVSNTLHVLRPVSFLVALPFLVFGYIIVSIGPPPDRSSDGEEKRAGKLLMIMFFPHGIDSLIPPNKTSQPTPKDGAAER